MSKEIQRMQRVRLILEEVLKEPILRKVFIARMSLKHGISARTINDYLQTLIDAGEVMIENKLIWSKDV